MHNFLYFGYGLDLVTCFQSIEKKEGLERKSHSFTVEKFGIHHLNQSRLISVISHVGVMYVMI